MNRETHLLWMMCKSHVNRLVSCYVQAHVTEFMGGTNPYIHECELSHKAIVEIYAAYWNLLDLEQVHSHKYDRTRLFIEFLYEESLEQVNKSLSYLELEKEINIELQSIKVFDDMHDIFKEILVYKCEPYGKTREVYVPVCQGWTDGKGTGWFHRETKKPVPKGTRVKSLAVNNEGKPTEGFYKIRVEKGSELDTTSEITVSGLHIRNFCDYIGLAYDPNKGIDLNKNYVIETPVTVPTENKQSIYSGTIIYEEGKPGTKLLISDGFGVERQTTGSPSQRH